MYFQKNPIKFEQICSQTVRYTDGQADRQIDKEKDRQIDDGQADRQTDR